MGIFPSLADPILDRPDWEKFPVWAVDFSRLAVKKTHLPSRFYSRYPSGTAPKWDATQSKGFRRLPVSRIHVDPFNQVLRRPLYIDRKWLLFLFFKNNIFFVFGYPPINQGPVHFCLLPEVILFFFSWNHYFFTLKLFCIVEETKQPPKVQSFTQDKKV